MVDHSNRTAVIVSEPEAHLDQFSSALDGVWTESLDYLGRTSQRHWGPEAFIVRFGPDRQAAAHFHDVDQFQLFFESAGATYKGRPIKTLLLHYADAYVTYGPFASGQGGLEFFTLRGSATDVTGYMPRDRSRLPAQHGRRQIQVGLDEFIGRPFPPTGQVQVETLIAPQRDSLAAYLLSAGADAELPLAALIGEEKNGAYLYQVEGELAVMGADYGRRSIAWLPAASVETFRSRGSRSILMKYGDSSSNIQRTGSEAEARPGDLPPIVAT